MATEEKQQKQKNQPQITHINVAMTLNCCLQASLTFAFEKTSRHKHAFSWASKLPMLGISSLQNIEGIIMWSTSTKPHWRGIYLSKAIQTALKQLPFVKEEVFTSQSRATRRLDSRDVGMLMLWPLEASRWASVRWSSPCDTGPTLWTCFGWCEWDQGWARHCTLPPPIWQQCENSTRQCRASVWAAPIALTQEYQVSNDVPWLQVN